MSLFRHQTTGETVSFLTMVKLDGHQLCLPGDTLRLYSDNSGGSGMVLKPFLDGPIITSGVVHSDQSVALLVMGNGQMVAMAHEDFSESFRCVGSEESLYDISKPLTAEEIDKMEAYALSRSRANSARIRKASLIILRLCNQARKVRYV